MTSAYTIDHVQSLAPTVENYMLLEDQLEYISHMSNWHRDQEDKLVRQLTRIPKKRHGSDEYNTIIHCIAHHRIEYDALSKDYQEFSPKNKEIEAILEEQGLIE